MYPIDINLITFEGGIVILDMDPNIFCISFYLIK